MTLRYLRLAGRMALILVVGAGLGGCLKFGATQRGKRVNPNADKTPIYKVSAEQLSSEFAEDRAAASARYKGFYLEVHGLVDRVVTNGLGDRSVVLMGQPGGGGDLGMAKEVRCRLTPEQKSRAADLTRTQEVTLSGRCEGQANAALDIDVEECELVKIGDDPSKEVSAKDLAKAFAVDPKKADKDYKGKQLRITGVFVEIRDMDRPRPLAILEGVEETPAPRLQIEASYLPDQRESFGRLEREQKITVKGECKGRTRDMVNVSYAVLAKTKR